MDDVAKFGVRFREMAIHQAKEAAKEVQEILHENDHQFLVSAEGLRFLAFALEDRAAEILKMGGVLVVTDMPLRKSITSSHHKLAGKKSGEARAKSGVKERFIAWALATNKASPGLSKNDVAQRFAAENPGTSVATLRRYLASIPTKYLED